MVDSMLLPSNEWNRLPEFGVLVIIHTYMNVHIEFIAFMNTCINSCYIHIYSVCTQCMHAYINRIHEHVLVIT